MKKFILSILLIVSITLVVFIVMRGIYPSNQVKELPKITIDGETLPTTGALRANDVDSQLSIKEMIKLGDEGRIDTPNFHLIHLKGSNFSVELPSPHDQNKQFFIKWLKDNGYSHVDPNEFTYINLP